MTTKEIKQNLAYQRSLLNVKKQSKELSDADFTTLDSILQSLDGLIEAVASAEDKIVALDKVNEKINKLREAVGLDETEGENMMKSISDMKEKISEMKSKKEIRKTLTDGVKEALKSIENTQGATDFRIMLKELATRKKSVTISPDGSLPIPEYMGLVEELILSGKLSQTLRIGRTTLKSGSVSIAVESSTGEAGQQAGLGTAKAEVSSTYTRKDVSIVTIAAFTRVAKQILNDIGWLESAVSNLIARKVRKAWELYLYNQITATTTAYDGTTNAAAIDKPQVADVIATGIAQMNLAGIETGIVVLMNPADYSGMKLLKDANGNYLNYESAIAGAIVDTNVNVPAGTVVFIATDYVLALINESDFSARVFEQDMDNVQKNLVTILCELYGVAAVETDGAVLSYSISAVTDAIEKVA